MYPPECVEVIEYIRRHVAKPDSLPRLVNTVGGDSLRWPGCDDRMSDFQSFCPFGLCHGVVMGVPGDTYIASIASLRNLEVRIFMRWWEHQTDAAAAVEAVWGEAK